MTTVTASWTAGATQYTYDHAGRLDFSTLPASTGITEDYGYDIADRLVSVTNTKAGAPPTTLSFANDVLNPNGNRSQVTDVTGVTQYGYDVLDRVSTVTYPSAPTTTAYTYDGVGNRLTQQVDANPQTAYTYDEADQLKTLNGVTNTFDKNGNLLTIGPGGNLPDTFLYDQENRLFREGPCRSDVNDDGKTNSTDQSIISHRPSANEGTTSYDLQVDTNEDLKINSTDLLIQGQESTKNCKSTGPNTGNGRSWYDGDGLRVRQRTFAATLPFIVNDDYVWDAGGALPVVLQDTQTPQGGTATTTTYLYGLGLISQTSGAGVTSYYLADGLGSTTQLTDSAGAITDSYSYDVFGAPRTVTGTTGNDFRYTGQQDDRNANRGLYFLRARSYDPTLGRFLQKDPLPLLNRYAYAGNNAANAMDPSGLCPWYELCDVPRPGIPVPFGPISVPDDLPVPDVHFNTDVAENWRRHINWIKGKFNGPQKKFFDPGYSPPPPGSLWPKAPTGFEDMRIPPGWCRQNPRTCAALAFLIGSGSTYEFLDQSGAFDETVNKLRSAKEQSGGSWFTAMPPP